MEANRMGTELMKRIRERAYQLWEAAGCEHGHDMEYWLRAEAQITAEQAKTQIQSSQNTSAPTSPTHTETAPKPRDSGKTTAQDEKKSTVAASPVQRKARSKR